MSDKILKSFTDPKDLKFRHIGFVVASIHDSAKSFTIPLGASWDGTVVFDPLQEVRGTFFQGRHPADPLIELVEPGAPDSPVTSDLEKDGGLHHCATRSGTWTPASGPAAHAGS